MIEILKHPMHWSIAGIIIGLTVPGLIIAGNKRFGISSTLKHLCTICIPSKVPYFQYDWKEHKWLFVFVIGIISGSFIAAFVLPDPNDLVIADKTRIFLSKYSITIGKELLPASIFSFEKLFSLGGFLFMVVGGFLVGFGTRYAEGCTSGHSIYGLSTLQWPSLVATICFMIGGIITANFILPFLLKLI